MLRAQQHSGEWYLKPGDGETSIIPLHEKLHSCFAGATSRSMASLEKQQPQWLPKMWHQCPRYMAAEAPLFKLAKIFEGLGFSELPEKVEKSPRHFRLGRSSCRRCFYIKEMMALIMKRQDWQVNLKQRVSLHCKLAHKTKCKASSQEWNSSPNAGLTISVYDDDSEEATAVQAMYLSQTTPTATYPVLVRPTTGPYTIPSDVLTDLLRMQGHLPLLDAIDAVDTCPKQVIRGCTRVPCGLLSIHKISNT